MLSPTRRRSSRSSAAAAAPPGWYPAPEGPFERWWDGFQWTSHARPLAAPAYGAPTGAMTAAVPGLPRPSQEPRGPQAG
jgi:hypothetical protein